MRTCLIINPNAGTAHQAEALRRVVADAPEITCLQTAAAGDAADAAEQALGDGYECVAAAGGDGTINEVVNGLMRHGGPVCLGVVPLGTGNDLARTLSLPEDPRDAIALVLGGRTQPLDVIAAEAEGETFYGINVAAGGFSGQVDEVLSAEMKKSWGPLAYLFSAASVLPDLHGYDVAIGFDEAPAESISALNVIVANGRTAAGGRRVAPQANPCDGLLDVVIVKWAPMLDLAGVAARLTAGRYLDSPHVVHRKVRRLHIESRPGMWFNLDGEMFTREPVTFTVRPGAVKVVVGPDFQAEPPPPPATPEDGA